MNPKALILLIFLLIFGGTEILAQKKMKRSDRKILGEQLDYGRKAAQFGLWNEAIFHWEKVVTEDPNNAQATNNLAVAYESIGAYEKANNLYRHALDLDEDSREIRKNMKRFRSFYRKHKRQLAREEKIKAKRQQQREEEKAEKEAEGKKEESL